jgi:hypothetical protein
MMLHLIVALLLTAAGTHQDATPFVEKSQKEFAFYPGGKLEVSAAVPGNVTITGWGKAAVRIEVEKTVYGLQPEEAQNRAKLFPVHITNTPTSVRISCATQVSPDTAMMIHFHIFVPLQKTDLNLKILSGDLSITTLNGSIEATLDAGNVELADLAGYFSVVTKAGDLNVSLRGKRWIGYGLYATTHCGDVHLVMPIDYSGTLQLQAKSGAVAADFPDQLVEGEHVPLAIVENKKAHCINAPIGSGGAPIRLATLLGNIALKGAR